MRVIKLDVNPTFEKYMEDFIYAKKYNMFDPHEELTPFETNPRKWNEKYWINLKMDFSKNASVKRLTHMRIVARVFYKEKSKELKKKEVKGHLNHL